MQPADMQPLNSAPSLTSKSTKALFDCGQPNFHSINPPTLASTDTSLNQRKIAAFLASFAQYHGAEPGAEPAAGDSGGFQDSLSFPTLICVLLR